MEEILKKYDHDVLEEEIKEKLIEDTNTIVNDLIKDSSTASLYKNDNGYMVIHKPTEEEEVFNTEGEYDNKMNAIFCFNLLSLNDLPWSN